MTKCLEQVQTMDGNGDNPDYKELFSQLEETLKTAQPSDSGNMFSGFEGEGFAPPSHEKYH